MNQSKNNQVSWWDEGTGRVLSLLSASILILTTIFIIYFIASKGLSTFLVNGVNPFEFLSGIEWSPEGDPPRFGAFPYILGSFIVTIGSALLAAPLGIGAAIFMTEISPEIGRRIMQPVIELLVGIPSVVYGFIGLSVIVPFLRDIFGGTGFSIIAGIVVLSIMILPTITSLSVDAIRRVPRDLKEASLALGATRWQTIWKIIILRSSLPGLLMAVILGMARAFGEALAVQMVIGNTTKIPNSLLSPSNTLTSGITLNMGNTIVGSAYNNALWSMGLILLLMTLIFILLIRWIGKRGQS
ncbi:phosphate ABC transporter permease subunit PstC [Ammoniphilus sp. CFH 90114]|uniref:phosphate ABC transporter permease subunit PstC n=1 Tax=Ammoniphilus sp. CFH 90114 TaxID=2493665 RepID=UPI00100EB688|nr:phosphate ABC transporter permease subunit PstC [Ammoniphilus sp. CFH 90114]RXT04055.1 phosphate ABC transporter permease subunit PstC [Ammoniphilus sp. CFH 90114]